MRFTDSASRGLNYTGAGISIQTANGSPTSLDVNIQELFTNAQYLGEKDFPRFVRQAIKHEVRHIGALKVIPEQDAVDLWGKLTPKLRNRIYSSYFAVDIHNAVAARDGKPKKLTERELLELTNDHLTGNGTLALPPADPFHMAHEFLRMLDEDAEFAGQTSEAMDADPGLGEAILAFLRRVMDEIKRLIDTDLPADVRVQVNEMRKLVEGARKKLLAELPARDPTRKGGSEPNLAQSKDGRRSVLAGNDEQGTPPAKADFRPVMVGKEGTAYTDGNDAIDYAWAVVDVNSLVISNLDDGRINPDYPQELQPRDRTSAGSEAQVADIARNMNLDRLSASNGVGDGAPIIGEDAVVESGNGRSMGQRRAYAQDGKAASSYRDALMERAGDFGLTRAQVEAVQNPVLVRIRKTPVDRVAFVLAANVSTIAPKREIEQAKIDAGQIVPDLFTTFVPTEDGDIFTPANADFIRAFVSAIVPPAERPAIIDARGNLTQTGLRRVRNALFVHAYGSSPETLNALSRLTESIDATGGNITNALVAAAPRFAEQQGRIAAGALYPLSITDDIAWTVQKLQDLRNRGERVADYLAQDGIPGIDDVPTPLQKALLQFFETNKAAPRQLSAALARYANAIDAAGDPKQISLFGDEPRPTREELWRLASQDRETPLATATKATMPPVAALNVFRKLDGQERRTEGQQRAYDAARRSLGSALRLDQPRKVLRRLSASTKAVDPRIEAKFGNWAHGWDANGFPNMPVTLPDGHPLLEQTLNKKTAKLRADHPLVAEGMLPAETEIPRKALHQAIVAFFMRHATPLPEGAQPTIYAMGGGGGAGKSSILGILKKAGAVDTSNTVEINADDIKLLIPEYQEIVDAKDGRAAMTVHEESSRLSNNLMDRAIPPNGKARYNVIFDGTLSNGPKSLKLISRWKAAGLRVHLIGVTIDPKEAIIRAVLRGADSGRWVPASVLLQAHQDFNGAVKSYLPEVEAADIYDNTPPDAHAVAQKSGADAPVSIANQELWSIIDRRSHESFDATNHSTGGASEGASAAGQDGPTALREIQSQGSDSQGQVNLPMGRRRATDDTGPDLFSFNSGLGLSDLLTPDQQESKLQQAAKLDLFGGTPNATPRPRPASPRPAQSARAPKPQGDAPAPADLGDLFAQPGLGAGAAGGDGGRPMGGGSGTGQPGGSGSSGNAAPAGGEAGGSGTNPGTAGNVEGGPGADMPGMPGDAGRADAESRPDVGSPDRNFEIPTDLESLAPATDRAKIQANIEAIRLLKTLEAERRNPTAEEKRVLASYTGWGAFKEAFNSKYEEDISEIWDKPNARRQYMPDWLKSWEFNHRANHKLLKEAMTEDEFASASASTLNAHYTALPIIRSMWQMVERLGFKGGRALEPSAGAGHYIGTTPATIADATKWQAVELDELSARLLSKLYPETTVNELQPDQFRAVTGLGFERARIPNGSLDLIISNVPFHESGPSKKGFPKLNLHNFFFAHALDKVKPGGLVAFITSESTMQNNVRQREFISSKGDLVAAFRLPNNAFKANAGTEVTTDILIFRKPDGTPFRGKDWKNLVEIGRQTITLTQGKDQSAEEFRNEAERTGEVIGKEFWKGDKRALNVSAPIMVNEYFVNHPQHALGNHTLASTMYRAGGYALVAPEGFDVKQALDALIPTLPENVMGVQEAADNKDKRLAGRNDKPFSFKEEDGKIFEVQPDGSMEEAEWSTNPELVKTWRSWRRVSDSVKQLVEAETSGDVSDDTLEQMRRALNVAYDSHILTHKPVSRRFSNQHKHLYSDPDYPLTAALEQEVITIDPKTGKKSYTYKKADIFKKRIGRPIVEPTTAANLSDALEKSLAWRGRVDPVFAGRLLAISPADFEERALRERSDLFRNPSSAMIETADDYLTGNVRVKLQQAEDAAQNDPRMQKNVDALRKAQPDRKEIARISPVLGARWVPAQVYNAFIKEVLQGNDTVEYIPAGNSWLIYGSGIYKTEEHGTERKGPGSLFKHALDMTEPMVWNGSGDTREFDPAATAAAKNALDKMRRAFIDFAKTSEAQVTLENEAGESKTIPVWEAVEDAFNESQNSYVTPRHTGDYLTFPGLNTDYVYTRAHRRAVIARFLSTRRGMMAHGVGSGKTFNQIILSFEMRRLGLAKKPMIVVQNATLGQFAKSFLKAYPTAKLLVPTKRDFEAANRRKLVAKIATGDWDAVLLPHSQFDLISNKPSAVKAYMDSQIDELMGIINSTKDKAKVRDLEGMIKRLKDRRQGMLDALAARQDTAIMWEDLGIDALIMDEAHNYKSLPIITRMGRVKGVPSSGNSQRAINFMLKCRDVQSRTGGKNIFLATGTPIKNSMAEAYIMMQFMAPDILEEFGIHNFDDFATAYGQTVTEAEMAWGGTPKMETRFAKFQNGPSLVTMIRTMFDVAFGNEKLGLDVPKVKGGEPEMVIIPATDAMEQFNAWTRSVNDDWQLATGEEKEQFTAVPIQTMAAGVAAALDPRLISPRLPDDPASKVNTAIRRVMGLYTAGTAKKTTQIIFSDLRNKFSMEYLLPFTGHPFPDYGSEGEFDLYADIKAKLVAAGVPDKEVHLMQSGMTDVQKASVFEKVDSGEIRIIIGSTELLGVGVNIQTRLKAVHHLAPPRDFTPAMMEQRNGRLIRQGNLHAEKVEGQPAWNQEVEILNYGTDGSMDSAIYGTLARKQRFITQLLSGEDVGDTFDDPTDPVAVNMAEMAARTLGDPDFIRRIELEREIKELRTLAEAFTTELAGKKSRLARLATEIRTAPETIDRLEQEARSFEKMWTRTAPRPEGVKQDTDITDKPVYEFGGQVVDTAAKDGAITGKLDLFLLDISKTTERRGKAYDVITMKVNDSPIRVRVDLTLPGSPTSGAVVDAQDNKLVSYSGAASLIQQLRRLPTDLRGSLDSIRRRTSEAQEQQQKLQSQLDQIGNEFPDAARLAALELEARQVDERIRAKVAPPPAPAAPAKDETADLPEMTPVPAGLMTFDVERVIDQADIIGNKVFIQEQLSRKLYEAVNKALEASGGRWSKKAKAHVFKGDPRPYLGLAPMPSQESSLAMPSKVAYASTHEQGTGLESDQLDRRTSGTTRIRGSRVTAEQGSAIRDVHFSRVLTGPLREGSAFARPKFNWKQPGASLASTLAAAFEVPILSERQEQAIRALPSNDTGVESIVYLDRENGVIYKRLQDSKGRPSGGIWPYVGTTSLKALDWSFQPADNLRSIGIRLALLTDIGGTPTEFAAIGPEGHIYLKQPLSPNPSLARDESFIDNAGMAVSRGRSGLVPIPSGMLPQNAPRAFMVHVRNRPWLVFDLHPDNFIGDNLGNGRINDPVFGVLKNSTISGVPGLASVVRQSKAEADRLKDRSSRLFMGSKSVANSSLPGDASPDDFRHRSAPDSRTDPANSPGFIARSVLGANRQKDAGKPPVQTLQGNRPAIAEEYRTLTLWAKAQGLIFDPAKLGAERDSRGEHKVYRAADPKSSRLFKVTYPGLSGLTRRALRLRDGSIRLMEDDALPSEYLDRWELHNELLNDATRFEGILESAAGPSIVVSQQYIHGSSPDAPPDLSKVGWTQESGYWTRPHPFDPSLIVGLADTKPSNWIRDDRTGITLSVDTLPFIVPDAIRAGTLAKSTTSAAVSPLARLGWNHLDRAASAKLAALARWTDEKTDVSQIVAKWKGSPGSRPFLDALRAIQGQFFPSSILPREVAAARREMDIKAAIGAQKGMDLVRALSGAPKFSDIAYPQEFAQNPMWRRRLYAAMTGEESMSALPPALQDLAKKLREMLLTIGREAVKQGRMSTDTFALLEESYMPHYYEEDVQKERSLFKRFRLGIHDIFAQRTTAWHIVDTQQQDKTGQPALVNWQPGKWRFRNKEHRDAFFEDFLLTQALERLKANGNAYERGLTLADLRAPAKLHEHTRGRLDEIRRVLRQRFRREAPLTIDEQEKAGLIMDPVYSIARYSAQMIHDNATAEFFNFVAAKPEWVSDVQVQGFTEIPDNPRFGRLAGKFVQQDIAGQLLEMTEAPTTALHIYDTILGWWKTGKTVLNPGTHVRNILGNLFFSQLAGTSVWNPGNLPFYRAAVKALRDGGGALQEAYEQGVLGADFVSAELRQQLRSLLPDPDTITPDNDATPGRLMGIGKAIGQFVQTIIANPSHKAYDKIAALYQAEDEVFKLAAYLKAKAMLGEPAAAAAHVRQWFPYFDQGSSPTLKALGRTAMPFLGFYRESIRIFGEALKNRPLALATGLSIPSLITFLSAAVLGLDDDELEQVRRDMRGRAGKLLGPTPLGGQPMFSLLLPFRSGSGALQQFDISAIHPFVDFIGNRVETDASEDWWQQTLRSLVAAGPIGSLIYSQMTGRDAFADRTFVEDNMTGSEKLAARLDNAAKTLLPPLAPGGTGFQTLANAGERQTNKTLEIRDPGQAALRAVVGLDVRNATPDLYRIADDWRKANGLPTSEGMDFGSTPVSRARKALFAQLAQPEPNRTAIQNIKQRLREMGSPVETEQDINRLLFYRNPLMIIRGEDNQQRFRASLTGLERNALESALREFEIIKARAPAFLR